MKTKILPDHALRVLKRHPRVYRAARRVRMGVGGVLPPRSIDGLPGRVHFNDFMLEGDSPEAVDKYRTRALNVIAAIERALERCGKGFGDVRSWLDFGCGYGRVLRFLVQRVDPDRVYASDVIHEGVDFCAAEFGVRPIYSRPELAQLNVGTYDFVYAISVITHLNEPNSREFLRLLRDWLEPGGIVLFTTHGQWSLQNLSFYDDGYEARRREIEDGVRERGIAFVEYHHYGNAGYGMTWHSREHIEASIRDLHGDSMRLIMHEPHGLDGHQDIFAYQRVA